MNNDAAKPNNLVLGTVTLVFAASLFASSEATAQPRQSRVVQEEYLGATFRSPRTNHCAPWAQIGCITIERQAQEKFVRIEIKDTFSKSVDMTVYQMTSSGSPLLLSPTGWDSGDFCSQSSPIRLHPKATHVLVYVWANDYRKTCSGDAFATRGVITAIFSEGKH